MSNNNKKLKPAIGRMKSNLARIASGTVLAQIILVVSTPLLTRLYSPEDFGVAALFSATYALLIPLVTLKFDQAMVLPKTNRSAELIGSMVMVIATVICIVVAVGVAFWTQHTRIEHTSSMMILPIALWLGAAYTLMQQWSARASNYRHFAQSQVIGAMVNMGVCIIGALMLPSQPLMLVLGFTAGTGVALIAIIRGFNSWPFFNLAIAIRTFPRRFVVYGKFPIFVLPTALVTIAGSSGIPFALAHHYSLEEVGVFAIAYRVLLIPTAIVGGALSEAVRAEFASHQRAREKVTPVFRKAFALIALIGGIFFGILFIAAPKAFSIVFGPEYAASGDIAQTLILAALSHFTCAPFMYVFAILRKPALGLLAQIIIALLPIVVLVTLASQSVSLLTTLLSYSICTLLGAMIMLALVYRGCITFDAKR